MSEVPQNDIVDYAQLVAGMIPYEFVALDEDALAKLEKVWGRTVSGSARYVSTYDPVQACGVTLIQYAALSKHEQYTQRSGLHLYWSDKTVPAIDIDLESREVWVACMDGSGEAELVSPTDEEIKLRALGALASVADTVL